MLLPAPKFLVVCFFCLNVQMVPSLQLDVIRLLCVYYCTTISITNFLLKTVNCMLLITGSNGERLMHLSLTSSYDSRLSQVVIVCRDSVSGCFHWTLGRA